MKLQDLEEEEATSFLGPSSSEHSTSGPRKGTGSSSGSSTKRSKILCLIITVLLVSLVLLGRTDKSAVEVEEGDVSLKKPKKKNPPAAVDKSNGAVAKNGGDEKDSKNDVAPDDGAIEVGGPAQVGAPVAVDTSTKTATTSAAATDVPKGFRKPAQEYSDTYLPRGKPLTDAQRQALTEKWGSWTLSVDTPRPDLPVDDYPNGDVPRSAFPPGAWQSDPVYLEKWLPEAIALTDRAVQAILAEYGHSKFDNDPEGAFMFNLTMLERRPGSKPAWSSKMGIGNAGFATASTLQAIQKRLLHSIVTEGSFVYVMGGHSASAGHGNQFQQSYTLQVQRVLEPILARLGVHHRAHNFGMGGLGTIQNAIAAKSLYGGGLIDILHWDSSMTEGGKKDKDLFARQGLLSGGPNRKVPVLWGEPDTARYVFNFLLDNPTPTLTTR